MQALSPVHNSHSIAGEGVVGKSSIIVYFPMLFHVQSHGVYCLNPTVKNKKIMIEHEF
jgi:hypothetical protein